MTYIVAFSGFQFPKGTIKRGLMPPGVPNYYGFNSQKVRLKEIKFKSMNLLKVSFNSQKVRLKVSGAAYTAFCFARFNSQKVRLKGSRNDAGISPNFCFNSQKVRLKVPNHRKR